jgi:hypothetical protein
LSDLIVLNNQQAVRDTEKALLRMNLPPIRPKLLDVGLNPVQCDTQVMSEQISSEIGKVRMKFATELLTKIDLQWPQNYRATRSKCRQGDEAPRSGCTRNLDIATMLYQR